MSGAARRRVRMRGRAVRRWAVPALAVLALAATLASVVARGEEGRRLTRAAAALEEETRIVQDRILVEGARVDSLTTLSRMEDAAAEIGLRQAVDAELVQVREADVGVEAGSGPGTTAGEGTR